MNDDRRLPVGERRIGERLAGHAQDDTDHRQDTTRHAQQVRGCFVLVVETPGGRYRRRTFLTLAAAERAVDRARLAGHASSVLLCRLDPVAAVA